ncbi:RES family NAD+ phosphorylase [Priestia megaterium]|uniref:RES family NAD+ phosphorylase n=1 Tax=Priestia megaterium TaxID=1404 RepID=UPI00203CD09C|nr:RES family NAD+ phosphorylase [Priestia megaterium]MCM3186371.1 RES family NAD+ phosphorylase [Priestia megaterium]
MNDCQQFFCSNCKEYRVVFETLEEWQIYNVPETVRGYEYNSLKKCPRCGNDIMLGTYVIKDIELFACSIGELIAEKISEAEIGECQYCNENIILYTQKHGDPSDLENVYALVEGHGFPTDISREIYLNIHCSNCGNELESNDPYVTAEEVENWYSNDVEIVINTFSGTTEYEGKDFMNYLLKNPMLGMNHELGQKIFFQIKNGNIPNLVTIEAGNRFLRGRTRKDNERMANYMPEELWNPPEGIPSQGRYNPPGISSLYMASSMDVVFNELSFIYNEGESIDFAEFLLLEDMRVWDVRDLDIEIFSSMPSLNKELKLSYEYIFPNFIAQCLMANNYNGIIYNSTRGDGYNFCLFNFKRDKDIVVEKVIPYNSIENQLKRLEQFPKKIIKEQADVDLPF